MTPSTIPVLILAGGKGTRIQHILKDTPKPLYPVNNYPFLDYLLGYLAQFGFKKFYLSIGYKSELFEKYYKSFDNIFFIKETEFLGTGGAVLNSLKYISEPDFLTLNGDTLYTMDYSEFINFCTSKKESPVIALKQVSDAKRYGCVMTDEQDKVIAFKEKNSDDTTSQWINAGIYFFNKKNFNEIQLSPVNSMEYDIFPKLISPGLYGWKSKGKFIDIGTPETLAQVEEFIKENNIAPLKKRN